MLQISLMVMNKVNYTKSAVFFSLVPKHLTIQNFFISTEADAVPCGDRKRPPHIPL